MAADKKLIKNGTIFQCGVGYYIRIHEFCVPVSMNRAISFDEIPEELITTIFNINDDVSKECE